jgi:hypothetical protein
MKFVLALVLVFMSAWVVFAVIDRIVDWAFKRGERDPYPEEFLYADPGRMHREVDRELERLAHRVSPAQSPTPTAGTATGTGTPHRSRTTKTSVGFITTYSGDFDRQSDYGEGTSLVGPARVEGKR